MPVTVIPRDPPTVRTGAIATSDEPASRITLDVSKQIAYYEPKAAMLSFLTRKMGTEKAMSNIVEWHEQDPYPRSSVIVGTQTSGDTTLEIPAGDEARFAANDVVKNKRTEELFLVTATGSGTLTVVRQWGGINAAMADGDKLELLFNANEEGGAKPALKSAKPVREFNYCQIFRKPFGATLTDEAVTMIAGGKPMVEEARKAAIEHTKSQELAFFYGRRHDAVGSNGKPQRALGGLDYYLKSRIFDFSGAPLTRRNVTEALEEAMRFGPNGYMEAGNASKWGFFSRRWLTELEALYSEQIEYRTLDDKVGLKVKVIQSVHGDLILSPSNIFTDEHSRHGFVVDMDCISYSPLRDTKLYVGIQTPGDDKEENEYRTECSLRVKLEGAHSKWIIASA